MGQEKSSHAFELRLLADIFACFKEKLTQFWLFNFLNKIYYLK